MRLSPRKVFYICISMTVDPLWICTFVDLLNLFCIYINVVWFSSGLMILGLASIDIILKKISHYVLSIFSLQKIKRTARKKLYYLLLISKFEGILHILKILEITCNFDRYIPFLQTTLWKFKETWHCTTWY